MKYSYIIFIIVIVISICIMAFSIDTLGKRDPTFVKEKSENYENVEYFAAVINGNNVKISKKFDEIEYKDEIYKKKTSKLYLSDKGKKIKILNHPYYYITHPILAENQLKHNHNIPKLIWQTMKNEPKEGTSVFDATNTFKKQKGWKYNFVTDEDGEKFLEENFHKDVLHAFRVLIPGAYKADLLRACLLYIHGGVYADAKLFLHYDLDSFLDRDLVLVREFEISLRENNGIGIWNGFMASTPKQEYFKLVIDKIVENVKNMEYGSSNISITGPILYGSEFVKYFGEETKSSKYRILNSSHINNDTKNVINMYKNEEIFISWDSKRNYAKFWSGKGYGELWTKRQVFDKDLHKKYFYI